MNTHKIPASIGKLFTTPEGRVSIMKQYGNSAFPYVGENIDGERVMVSISTDSMVISTWQHNGWVRVDYYDASGYLDGETYNGKWNGEE